MRTMVILAVVLLLAASSVLPQQSGSTAPPIVFRVTPADAMSRLKITDSIAGWRPSSLPAMAAFEVFVDATGKITEARSFATAREADMASAQGTVKNLAFAPVEYQGSAVPFVTVVALCSDSEFGTVPCTPLLNDQHGVSSPAPQRLRLPGCDDPESWKACNVAAMKQRKISGRNPLYPENAKHARIMGNVAVRVAVSSAGEVISTQVLGGPPMLYEASVRALKTWKYKPLTWNGMAVEVEFNAVMRYELRG